MGRRWDLGTRRQYEDKIT